MRQILVLGILCAAIGSAMAGAPFAPIAEVPDYVATMVGHEASSTKQTARTVMRHGDWTRVDTTKGTFKTTSYFAASGTLEIDASGDSSDGIHLWLTLNRRPIAGDTESRNTAERQSVLGESCTVWNLQRAMHPVRADSRLEQTSCVTDDGIELWSRLVGNDRSGSSAETIRIERRPVSPDDVQPPRDILTLGWWNKEESASAAATPDFEVVMELAGNPDGGKLTRTIRQRYPWRYEEERAGDTLRRLNISHAATRQSLQFVAFTGSAEKRLMISDLPAGPPVTEHEPKDSERVETVLGESCQEFDRTQGVADAGEAECRTRDGIPLKQTQWSRGFQRVWTAVRMVRRPVALDEVKPPNEILSLDWWTKQ
jgi:hypothetical protein